jgi:hypothetical protein
MIPASSKVLLAIVPVLLIPVVMLVLFGYITYSCRHVRFVVDEQALHIRGDLYGRDIRLSSLKVEDAKIVDLDQDRQLHPTVRTNGAGLPGYRSGWFKLANGEKALLFMTDPRGVVYVPTSEGYSVLLSVADAEGFLAALRKHERSARP